MDEQQAKRPSPARRIREVAETLLLALAIYLGVQFFVPPFQVEGASMDPNLQDGERLLINRQVYAHFDLNKLWNWLPGVEREGEWIVHPFHAPERGDIVVFDPPIESDKPYIKRVIGLPGDEISFADGYVLVNGERLDESYLDGAITSCEGDPHCRVTVPDGAVYVLGDNRDNSYDSRALGPIDADAIVGKAWIANWPLDEIGFIPGADYDE